MRSTLEDIGDGNYKLTLFCGEDMSKLEVEELVRDILCGYILLDGEIIKHDEDLQLISILSHQIISGKVEFIVGTRYKKSY